ncbi:uncharacterized protein LOC133888102 [Phragmites australis]|uniref:uncharacterized protein LOC133888102 n=1 Tax=Phragmites australis TaxID=29695 RepID=UPI002D77F1A0|nr:uncharacterized protein LOC133888102 [Phragmites australis]
MERRSSGASASVVVVLLASFLAGCHGARDVPAEPEKPLRPQNVFGFGGFYPGPSINWVFPGPNGVTPQVGFGGMPGGSTAFPGVGGRGGVSPFTPGGGGVVGIHGAGASAGAGGAAKKP